MVQVSTELAKLPGVVVIPRDDELRYKHTHSRIWNETWLSAFFHKPCNHELFVLQSLNMEGEFKENFQTASEDEGSYVTLFKVTLSLEGTPLNSPLGQCNC